MSPHAISPTLASSRASDQVSDTVDGVDESTTSQLKRYDNEEIQDVIGVGFGPASLAIAVALHDALEAGGSSLRVKNPKVQFLEKQSAFAWHAGMLLPGAKMQIAFVKDLATLRNPRSEFTFLNYLHRKKRLVAFTNLSTFLPQRVEFEDYMRWCAGHFDDVVTYGQDVEAVEVGKTNTKTGAVEYFQVRSKDIETGEVSTRRARHIILALGGRPNIPKCLHANHPRVIHSSQYATSISSIFPDGTQPRSVAVVGAGQSAAEIFHNIPKRFPGSKSYLLMRGSALRPSDDSPFVNEVFDPERVDDIYSQEADVRAASIVTDKATNYGVVRLELLEDIYSTLYAYRTQYESESDWPQQILPHRSIRGMTDHTDDDSTPTAIRLHVQNDSATYRSQPESPEDEDLDVDLVIVASGYRRDAHEEMMQSLRTFSTDQNEQFAVGRNYNVEFKPGAIAPDAGVWLQGCNEGTHGLSDTLLSILAVRGGEMVQNIFG